MTLLHAIPILGCRIFPLPFHFNSEILQQLLITARINCLITDSITINKHPKVLIIDARQLNINVTQINPYVNYSRALTLKDIMLFIATSGSSANPKIVMLSGDNIAAAVTAVRERISLQTTDRWLLCLPLYHIGGIAIVHRCTQAGAVVVISDNSDGAAIAQALITHRCTHVSLVPAMLARLLKVIPKPPSYLRYALIGGAALHSSLAQVAIAQGWPLCISYGMSETCSQIATLCNPDQNWPGQLVGMPLSGIQVRIDHTSGCIQVRGKMLMVGYSNPQGYSDVYIDENGWFTTNDLGYIDANGQLWITGRADQVLNSGGVKVHPEQIENLLQSCPNIVEVSIGGRCDPIWGEIIVAVYVGTAEPIAVETWCRQHIQSSIRPRIFIKVDRLPRTSLEKIDRNALRALYSTYRTNNSHD
jgi:O-succinylbenzoic acid--CoA ligase